ncbi:winged helix-turn-helix domain-containing protein [Salinicola halophilus]|uniref:winged helix-turn-helix domain-containing protein n=1 Tax=Salinicola halophilus TaxID=184065 RepID=UPI000DA181E7|nr:winged helix-turn-helix domain-containing protein [Salinicola halophilus]
MTQPRPSPPRLQLRLTLDGDVAVGPGKIALLEAIERHGSIAAACREMRLSYKKAWQLIETMNRHLENPVLETRAGGSQRGGAVVTPTGRALIARYRALLDKVTELAEAEQLLMLLASSESRGDVEDARPDEAPQS